jgi:hypothetical protein
LLRVWDVERPELWPTLTWNPSNREIGAEIDEEALAALPNILDAAQGTPEYQPLRWAARILGGRAVAVGGMA